MTSAELLKALNGRIRVANGACPKGHSLMSDEKLFDGERSIAATAHVSGQVGMIYMNPFYGKFEFECGIEMGQRAVVELFCPKCETSLAIEDICRICNIPMFAIHLPDGGQVEACPRVGCHNHALKIVNLDEQLDRMYVDETKVQM